MYRIQRYFYYVSIKGQETLVLHYFFLRSKLNVLRKEDPVATEDKEKILFMKLTVVTVKQFTFVNLNGV